MVATLIKHDNMYTTIHIQWSVNYACNEAHRDKQENLHVYYVCVLVHNIMSIHYLLLLLLQAS